MKITYVEWQDFWEHALEDPKADNWFIDDCDTEVPDKWEGVLDVEGAICSQWQGAPQPNKVITATMLYKGDRHWNFAHLMRKWRKMKTTVTLVVEINRELEAELRAWVKERKGKIL